MSELPCGLDHHIPTKADRNTITAEFEQFLSESIKRYLTHSWTKKVGQRKTKLRNTCEKYFNVKISNYHKRVLSELEDISIMKLVKDRVVVIMDKTKYTKKCLILSPTMQFQTLYFEPKKSTESKVQKMLRKIKSKLPI